LKFSFDVFLFNINQLKIFKKRFDLASIPVDHDNAKARPSNA